MTLAELLVLLKKHIRLLIVLPVACALAVGAYAYLAMEDTYTATTSMYVMVGAALDTSDTTSYTDSSNTLQSDLNSSQMITTDVADLLTSSRVVRETAQELGLDNLDAFDIQVSSSDSSRVIDLSVSGTDPDTATQVADTLVERVSEVAQEVMGVASVNSVDDAQRPGEPSGPNRPLYVAVAALSGFALAVTIVVLFDFLNMRIRSEEDLEDITGLPIMGRVPYVREGGVVRG